MSQNPQKPLRKIFSTIPDEYKKLLAQDAAAEKEASNKEVTESDPENSADDEIDMNEGDIDAETYDDDDDSDDNYEDEWQILLDIDEEAQDNLLSFARQVLPDTQEISKTLDNIDYIDFDAVAAAMIVQEEFRDRLSIEEVDRMTAAALLAASHDMDSVAEILDPQTVELADVVRQNLNRRDNGEDLFGFIESSDPAQRVFFAFHIAEVVNIAIDMEMDEDLVPGDDELGYIADMLADMAEAAQIDPHLLERAVKNFNDLSEKAGQGIRIRLDEDNLISVLEAYKPPPAPTKKPQGPKKF